MLSCNFVGSIFYGYLGSIAKFGLIDAALGMSLDKVRCRSYRCSIVIDEGLSEGMEVGCELGEMVN